MKVPVFYIPKTKYKKYLVIEKIFKCKEEIIPLGCDCHPAYTLQKLNIRKHSLPFDWLNTDPVKGLDFVTSNINSNFSDFLKNLYKNSRGHLVSEKYPHAEFIHEKNLIQNKGDREKFSRRISRFQNLINKACHFLYNITSESLTSENEVNYFYNSVVKFSSQLKDKQLLFIYIRYDESFDENQNNCEVLLDLLENLENVRTAKYIRKKGTEGIWGNERVYPELYKNLGLPISLGFPKIYLK